MHFDCSGRGGEMRDLIKALASFISYKLLEDLSGRSHNFTVGS